MSYHTQYNSQLPMPQATNQMTLPIAISIARKTYPAIATVKSTLTFEKDRDFEFE